MLNSLITRLRDAAPGVTGAARKASRALPATRSNTARVHERVDALEEQLAELRQHLAELRGEIDETRQDALRVAELADIVEHRLAEPGTK